MNTKKKEKYPVEESPLGGNRFSVTLDGITTPVDFSGLIIVSDEDYDKISRAQVDSEVINAPKHMTNKWSKKAAHHVASGGYFNVKAYIQDPV